MSPGYFISIIVLSPNGICLQESSEISALPVTGTHAILFRSLRQHADTSPVIHQMIQLAAGRRWGKDRVRRRRCPSEGAAPPAGGLRHSPITPPAGTATQRSPSIGQYGGIEIWRITSELRRVRKSVVPQRVQHPPPAAPWTRSGKKSSGSGR